MRINFGYVLPNDGKIIMTFAEAKEAGYKPAFRKWSRGYITRKPTPYESIPVFMGRGFRSGQLYINYPTRSSTRYHQRVYLSK